MTQMGNTDSKKKLIYILIALTLTFIWGHSMIPADLSTEESSYFVNLINGLLSPFLSSMGIVFSVTDHMVRKTAHFMEYALLGGEICLLSICKGGIYQSGGNPPKTVSTDTVLTKNVQAHGPGDGKAQIVPWSAAYVFWVGVPVIDEFIQYFTPGRACMRQDVLLDMTGFAAGFLFLRGCAVLWNGKHK